MTIFFQLLYASVHKPLIYLDKCKNCMDYRILLVINILTFSYCLYTFTIISG